MLARDSASPIGRPREFDSDAVLDAAVNLFRQKGYGATSVSDIVEHTGLSKSSLYGAFGSKDALYEKALERYLAGHCETVEDALLNGSRGLADIDDFFFEVETQVEQQEIQGCLAVNTATELRTTEPAIVQLGIHHREAMRQGFVAALERAVELGEIESRLVHDMANNLVATSLGLAVMLGGGATPDEIRAHLTSMRNSLRTP